MAPKVIDTSNWIEEKRSAPRRDAAHGVYRHKWRHGTHREHWTCEVCGAEKILERVKVQGSVGPRIPETRYRGGPEGYWRPERPNCRDPRQRELFGAPEKQDDPRQTVPASSVIHEAVDIVEDAKKPKRPAGLEGRVYEPKVTQHEVGVFPEGSGVSVVLTIEDTSELFASEYRWEIFAHREAGCPPIPNGMMLKTECSIRKADEHATAFRNMLMPHNGLWVVCRSSGGYVRAWRGDGVKWVFREKGERP